MCGLVGYLDLRDEHRVEMNVLARIADALSQRGPDNSGYFIEDNVGLGFRRLRVNDLEGAIEWEWLKAK